MQGSGHYPHSTMMRTKRIIMMLGMIEWAMGAWAASVPALQLATRRAVEVVADSSYHKSLGNQIHLRTMLEVGMMVQMRTMRY